MLGSHPWLFWIRVLGVPSLAACLKGSWVPFLTACSQAAWLPLMSVFPNFFTLHFLLAHHVFFAFRSLFSTVGTFPPLTPCRGFGAFNILTSCDSFLHLTSYLARLCGVESTSSITSTVQICVFSPLHATTKSYFRSNSTPSGSFNFLIHSLAWHLTSARIQVSRSSRSCNLAKVCPCGSCFISPPQWSPLAH